MKLRNWFGTDELAVVRFTMRMMACWPENRTWWKNVISFLYPVPCIIYTFFIGCFFVFEAKKEGMITFLQSASDFFGNSTLIVRAIAVRRHAQEIYDIHKMISDDFGPLEKKLGKVRIQRPLVFWCPSILFAVQVTVSVIVSVLTMMEPPERRELSLRISDWMVRNDFRFFTLTTLFVLGHWPVYFSNASAEALIISLSTVVCEKIETLKKNILQLRSESDHSELELELTKAIKYHSLVGDLRNRTETICGGSMLFQLFFILVSLGSPGLRIVFAELKTEVLGFMAIYVLWVSSMLIIYCELFDEATRTSGTIGFTAYSIYDPAMSHSVTQKLIIMMSVAKQPLNFTANGLVKLNRRSLLQIYKESYRFYSAVLNLR